MNGTQIALLIYFSIITAINLATMLIIKRQYQKFLFQLWSWQSYIYRWVREELDRAASNKTRR